MRDGDRLLVVKERDHPQWKFPGGYVNLGEDFGDAAAREVFEETNIRSAFDRILLIRHSHKIQFETRGDVYVMCLMKLITRDIKVDEEIAEAKWMDISEFKALNKHPMHADVLKLLENGDENRGFTEKTMDSTIKGRLPFKVYSPTPI